MNEITPIQKKAGKYFGTYLTIIITIAAFGAGVVAGQFLLFKKDVTNAQVNLILGENNTSTVIDFNQFWTVWGMVKSRYIKKDTVEDKNLYYGAMQGVVASLGDPYSMFMPPKDTVQFTKDLSGELEGIGAEIAVRSNQLMIVTPLPDTPASKAGLMPGDKILFIDKISTAGMDVNEAVSKIRGPAKTIVVLTISRNGTIKEVPITRAKINVPAVTFTLKPNNIGYLRVAQFNDSTMPELNKAIQSMKRQKVKGIIVDLRNNPGGYLETAVDMASLWLEFGAVVSEKDANGVTNIHVSRGLHDLAGYKTLVLVNKGSASASEIVAGALQDHHLATLMGETTFGKGSVQDLQSFADGSSIKLTIAEWFTPNGKNINEAGVTPDIIFKQDYEKEKPGQDTMLQKALNWFVPKK